MMGHTMDPTALKWLNFFLTKQELYFGNVCLIDHRLATEVATVLSLDIHGLRQINKVT